MQIKIVSMAMGRHHKRIIVAPALYGSSNGTILFYIPGQAQIVVTVCGYEMPVSKFLPFRCVKFLEVLFDEIIYGRLICEKDILKTRFEQLLLL